MVHENNQSTIATANSLRFTSQTKYITIKYHINSWSSLELSTHAELEVVLASPNMFKMQNHDEIVKSRFAIKYFMTMDLLSH